MHLGIIHGNQQDRNSGGEIWSRDDSRDGNFPTEIITHEIISFGDRQLITTMIVVRLWLTLIQADEATRK